MCYMFVMYGADDEVYAIKCHNIVDKNASQRVFDSDKIVKWLNFRYGNLEKTFDLINSGEINTMYIDFETGIEHISYVEESFDERQILYYNNVVDVIIELEPNTSIFIYNESGNFWREI